MTQTMKQTELHLLAGSHELPADDTLFGLLQEALLLRRRALELELGGCRQRIELIEGRYGLPRAELATAVATGAIDVAASEARLWLAELLRAQRLEADIERLAQVQVVRAGGTGCAGGSERLVSGGSPHDAPAGEPISKPEPVGRIPANRRGRAIGRGPVAVRPRPVGEAVRPAA